MMDTKVIGIGIKVITKTTVALAVSSFILSTPQLATAISLGDIEDEAFFTIFADTGGIDAAGQIYAPTLEQNPIGSIATFETPGAVAFVNNPDFYLVNPNAWAFSGQNSARIIFNEEIDLVSLAVRGTSANDLTGGASIFPFDPNTTLADAMGIVSALDEMGNIIAGSTTDIQNLPLQGPASGALNEINFNSDALRESIFGLLFEQNANDVNAGIFVGGLGITPSTAQTAPEPTSILGLMGILGFGYVLRINKQSKT